MLRWLALAMLLPGAAHAAPAGAVRMPLASHFDLARLMMQPTSLESDGHAVPSRWQIAEIAPPPGPPRDPPMVRVRGKKVKFRMRF